MDRRAKEILKDVAVTVWKIAKTYGISRPRGRKPKNQQPTAAE